MPADELLSGTKRVHIVGIGGAGMSAIAEVLAAQGHIVTGSDLKASPTTERLGYRNIEIFIGHQASNLPACDFVTASPAVSPTNPEIEAAHTRSIPVITRASVMAAIVATRPTIAIAGTHGKTTTSSMLAMILSTAGLDPSFLIGAEVAGRGTNAVWGSGDVLVVEADESYGTFTEMEPSWSVVTNIEPDHLDHYGDVASLDAAFADFMGRARNGAIINADDETASALLRDAGTSVGTSNGATVHLEVHALERLSASFSLRGEGLDARFVVHAPGLHNVMNAALAVVAAHKIGVPTAVIQDGLARFTGVPRRFEFRGEAGGVTFIDDYAHLPSEVHATLAAARSGGWNRIICVFQPHRYTRTQRLAASFSTSFDGATDVVVTDIYSAGEPPIPGVTGRLVADAISANPQSPPVHYVAHSADLVATVGALLEPGDLCLTLGAGDLTDLCDHLIAHLRGQR